MLHTVVWCVAVCVCVCVSWTENEQRKKSPCGCCDSDPCGRLSSHHDIFWGSRAPNTRNGVGAEQAVAMQQFIASSIQVGPEWRAAVRRRGWFECVLWKAGGKQRFCSSLVGELSVDLIMWKLNGEHRARAAANGDTVQINLEDRDGGSVKTGKVGPGWTEWH